MRRERIVGPFPAIYPSTNIMLAQFLTTSIMHAKRNDQVKKSISWFAAIQNKATEGLSNDNLGP